MDLPQRHPLHWQVLEQQTHWQSHLILQNGNELKGNYTHKPEMIGEDEEPPKEPEDGASEATPKYKFDINFQAYTKISDSAHLINSVEQ
jgi:hypothetical protein